MSGIALILGRPADPLTGWCLRGQYRSESYVHPFVSEIPRLEGPVLVENSVVAGETLRSVAPQRRRGINYYSSNFRKST